MEVWAAVYEDTLPRVRDHEGRGAQATVTRIVTMTGRAATSHLGDTSARACT